MYCNKYYESLIDKLQEVAPTAFPKKPLPKVPLAPRQHKALQAILDVPWHTAEHILKLWCHGKRYDKACSTQYAPRYRVDGTECGYVTAVEAVYHQRKLDEYYATKKPRNLLRCVNKPPTLRDKLRILWHQCIQKCSRVEQGGVL